jgi:hypothetical protein
MDFAGAFESFAAVAGDLAGRLQNYLPSLFLASGLILVGWLVGSVLRAWSVRLIGVVERRFWQRAQRLVTVDAGTERHASEIIGSFVFWAVFVLFLAAATDALGLPVLSIWLSGLSQFLPRLLLATLIVLAGVLAGRLARDAIAAAVTTGGLAFGTALGRAAQIAIVTAAGVTAVDQIGIESGFFTSVVLIAVGTLLGGTALAFGFGARTSAGNKRFSQHCSAQALKRFSFPRATEARRLGVNHWEFVSLGATLLNPSDAAQRDVHPRRSVVHLVLHFVERPLQFEESDPRCDGIGRRRQERCVTGPRAPQVAFDKRRA